MRVKILEGLAAGKAIVATPLALEGLALQDGVQVRVAEDDSEFVDAVVDLLTNVERRVTIAKAAAVGGAVPGYGRAGAGLRGPVHVPARRCRPGPVLTRCHHRPAGLSRLRRAPGRIGPTAVRARAQIGRDVRRRG